MTNTDSWGNFKTIDNEFKKIAKEVGMIGASVVFHPARFHDKKMLPYASPHFHTIAYGWFDGRIIAKIAILFHFIGNLFKDCTHVVQFHKIGHILEKNFRR